MTRPLPWRGALGAVAVLAAIAWAWWYSGFAPAALWSVHGLDSLAEQARRLAAPALDGKNLARAGGALITTLALATAGSFLAGILALLLLPAVAATMTVRPVAGTGRSLLGRGCWRFLHHGCRLLANLLRSMPYLVWALLLVLLFGFGPWPAALALALHTAGVLAWLWAGAVDGLEVGPQRALRDAGSGRMGRVLFALLPQARAQLAGYWLYRWEINLREATVLGLAGCGGLGQELAESYAYFDHGRLATTLLALVLLVLAGERLSAAVRRRLG